MVCLVITINLLELSMCEHKISNYSRVASNQQSVVTVHFPSTHKYDKYSWVTFVIFNSFDCIC